MKVLHITASSKGGAGIAAMRLNKALLENDVSSAYLSKDVSLDFYGNTLQYDFFKYKKASLFKRVFLKLKSIVCLNSRQKIIQKITNKQSLIKCELLSLPYSSYRLEDHPLVKEADVLNFHWMGGILDYETFFKKCKKPIVWTLHDMNPFQGVFHYKNDVLYNKSSLGEVDAQIEKHKINLLSKSNLKAFVSPSNWLLEELNKCNFFTGIKKTVIANSIDFSVFENLNRELIREEHNINSNEFVVLFVAESIENRRKGFDLLLEALLLLEHLPLTLVTVGKGNFHNFKFKNVSLGAVNDSKIMASCYVMADVFLLPSREDNLPNVMLESFAAGTPVVSFTNGGMKEHIIEDETGNLVSHFTSKDLAFVIEKNYMNRFNFSKEQIKKYAQQHFNYKKQAEEYKKIYLEL